MEPRLKKHYNEKVRAKLQEQFGFVSPVQIPTVTKVVLNVGIGGASKEQKLLKSVVEEMTVIAGQKPVITKARKSISNFSLREGMPVGVPQAPLDREHGRPRSGLACRPSSGGQVT